MNDIYKYLFPFEKVPLDAKILIYGAGKVGREYLRQLLLTHYCNLVGIVDKNAQNINNMPVPVYLPDDINRVSFDYIVIAIMDQMHVAEIMHSLREMGYQSDCIIPAMTRIERENVFRLHENDERALPDLAFQKTNLSIAVRMGWHLGDCIQRKAAFVELAKAFSGCLIDIYVENGTFVKSIYKDQDQLNAIVEGKNDIFQAKKTKYILAITLSFELQINHVDYSLEQVIPDDWRCKLHLLENSCNTYGLRPLLETPSRILCERALYKKWNCYQFYNYCSLIDVKSTKVGIPMDKAFEAEFSSMGMNKYITLSYGNSTIIKGTESINSRQWSLKYFQRFIELFKVKYPAISIVQIGDENSIALAGADFYVLGKNLELVKYVLRGAIFHLDTEGGLMHLATQLGTMCIALFGPTQVQLFGYKENINIVSEKCNGCYYLYDNQFQCARGLEQPECMYSIFPEIVMEKADEYLKSCSF